MNLGIELDVVSLDVLDDHNLHLRQEVQRQFAHCVSEIIKFNFLLIFKICRKMSPENALLNEQDVAAGILDLLAELQQIRSLLLQGTVHLRVVRNDHLVLHLNLGI